MKWTSILSGLLVTAVTLAALEFGAWLVFRSGRAVRLPRPRVENAFHPYLGWDNRPDFEYHGDLANGLQPWSVRTDSSGLVPTPLRRFDPPEVRVVLTGGSAAFGHGQTGSEHTVAAHLEEVLCRTGRKVEVYNLAVRGYTSFQEMLCLQRFLADHPADLVVSLSGFNDGVAAALEDGREFGLLLHRREPKVELIRSMERGDLDVLPVAARLGIEALRRKSCAVDLLGKVSDRLARPRPTPDPWEGVPAPDSQEVVRRARLSAANYGTMRELCERHGARYVMALQPTAMTRARLTAFERQAMDSLSGPLLGRVLPVMRIFYGTLRGEPQPFEFRDLTGCFDGFDGPAFGDDCHYLDRATPTLASALGEAVAPLLDRPEGRPSLATAARPR